MEKWKEDVFQQLLTRNVNQTETVRSVVQDYIKLTKQYDVQGEELVKLKTQITRGVANNIPIPTSADKVTKLENTIRELQVKISRAYRDAALASDTFAYTSVMLRDSKQLLDETTRENIELQEKLGTLEKQHALTTHKYNLATQVAEELQKKFTDLQVKEDALALAYRNLQNQVDFLRLQATSAPFPYPNSLPNNFNFNDSYMSEHMRKKADENNNNNYNSYTTKGGNTDKRNSSAGFASPKATSTEKRNSTPTLSIKSSPGSTPTSTTPPASSPSSFYPSPHFNQFTSSMPITNYGHSPREPNSPTHFENLHHLPRSTSEPIIIDPSQQTNEGITPRLIHMHPMEQFDADPNAANVNALTAYAMLAQATHARAQALKASNSTASAPLAMNTNGVNTSTNVGAGYASASAYASMSSLSKSMSGISINSKVPAPSPEDFDVRRPITVSDQPGSHTPELSRFHSMPNFGAKSMKVPVFSTKMILSGRPIEAHQQLICATFHVSGEMLATGGADHFVKVWDTSNHGGVPVYKKSLQEATSSVLSVQFSPRDNLLCGTSNNKNSYVWDPITGRELHTLSGHTEKVTGATFLMEDQLLASCSWDRHLKLFDLNTGFCTGSFPLGSRMNSVCVGPFNFTVCTAHVDKTIRVFDYRNSNTMHTIEAHSAAVTGVCSCPDNQTNVLTSGKDNTLKLIDLRTLEIVHTYKHSEYKNQRDINLTCFSPNGKFIVAGGDEGKIVFWNTQTTKVENVITCSPKSNKCVTCVTWNPRRNQLIACHDNSLYLYDGEVMQAMT